MVMEGVGAGVQLNSDLYSMFRPIQIHASSVYVHVQRIYLCTCVYVVLWLLCVLHKWIQHKSEHLDLILV